MTIYSYTVNSAFEHCRLIVNKYENILLTKEGFFKYDGTFIGGYEELKDKLNKLKFKGTVDIDSTFLRSKTCC
jgi:hypothetical protein